ncbi:class 1a ribonucleoside-diphosphate reductase subunit alpha [Ferrimonas marina]|uniref:Ribonucleoside-diphosphate reductase n=1 Tax=Ferrimonas marina TaxID=299255 RepID=A0A1M5UI37_9GAMM|nr:class 1a ribonucleoside-diphosphate reductase subunit alpha [Ferrimonas marina]SHH62580.1 ribonucleoside-diphosphate reductase alpha chain [Ferrimonas marina]
MTQIRTKKRDGRLEPIAIEKIHRVVQWAAEGLDDVSASQVELSAKIQFYDGIPTEDIHRILTKAAADLISEDAPGYQQLAARLAVFQLRKAAYAQFTPPTLYDHLKRMVRLGRYDASLLEQYSREAWDHLETVVEHHRDLELAYAGVTQFEGKYLVQDRSTGQVFETPQMAMMMICATLFIEEKDPVARLQWVEQFYQALSQGKISLPTPIMGGMRTPTRQFSSCVLIESGDSLASINATSAAIVDYVSQRAGIGINGGRIRGAGSPIRGGEAVHTGCIPFYKHFQTAVKSCSQGGIRGGAATLYYPLWHIEAQDLLVLKNNKGVEANRIRHLDYGVQLNRLMYERLQQGGNITLFSPGDVPDLYDAFFADQALFRVLYERYEQQEDLRKIVLKAEDLFMVLVQERANTGRIFIQNVDNCNDFGPFRAELAPIKQSNLCAEIALPTKPLQYPGDPEGEIALCTLLAFNLGALESLDELEHLARLAVRGLDNLLDYQNYPLEAAERSTMNRRPLGVGVINYAYYLAKNGMKYSDGSANDLTHRTFEAIQFYLMQASMELAKERGPCPLFGETKMSQGILPIDTYKKQVDRHHNQPLLLDWEGLRANILAHGVRNSTVSALMPSETSSQVANATNGIEPPRGLVSVKSSKDGIYRQVVPEINRLRDQYELLWDMPDNDGYLVLCALMQKFVDQAISANTNYDPGKFPDGRIPVKRLLRDLAYFYSLGGKTLYYQNTRDGQKEHSGAVESAPVEAMVIEDDGDCDGGGCKI